MITLKYYRKPIPKVGWVSISVWRWNVSCGPTQTKMSIYAPVEDPGFNGTTGSPGPKLQTGKRSRYTGTYGITLYIGSRTRLQWSLLLPNMDWYTSVMWFVHTNLWVDELESVRYGRSFLSWGWKVRDSEKGGKLGRGQTEFRYAVRQRSSWSLRGPGECLSR